MRVNMLPAPITIDDPKPHFSWTIEGGTFRGIVGTGYSIQMRNIATGAMVWDSGKVTSNRTTYIPYGDAATALVSDTSYMWEVKSYFTVGSDAAEQLASGNSTFSTALMEQSDWDPSTQWISLPASDLNTQFASQMRKVFTIPKSVAAPTQARVFLALPGYGQLSINGQRVDDPSTGTRSLSQYESINANSVFLTYLSPCICTIRFSFL